MGRDVPQALQRVEKGRQGALCVAGTPAIKPVAVPERVFVTFLHGGAGHRVHVDLEEDHGLFGPGPFLEEPSQAGKAGSRGRRSRRRPVAAYTRLSDVTTIVPIQAFQAPAQSAPVDSSTRNATLSTGTSPTVRTPVAGNARTSSRPGTTAQNGIAAQASQGTNWPASASADSSTASHIPHGPLDRPSGSAGAGTRAARTPGADMI